MKSKLQFSYEEATLDTFSDFEKKSSIKAGEGNESGKYRFFTSSNNQNKFLNEYICDGEYLIFNTGGNAGVHYCDGKFSTSTDCFVVKVNEKIITKYVYYFLRSNMHILEEGFRGSGLKHISKEYIKNIKIIYPVRSIQKKIITIFDNIEKVELMRNESDELTKKYRQSVFLEIFGDPVKNPRKWKYSTVREISDKISDGPFGSNLKTEHYTKHGIRVIRLQNISVENWIDDDKAFVSEKHYQTIKKHTCEPNDVIVGTMGNPNLRACLLPPEIKIAINKADCVQIKPNKKIITSEYLCSLLNQPSFVFLASSFMHGQTRTRISMGQVASLKIPIPPLELQQKYVKIISKLKLIEKFQNNSRMCLFDISNTFAQKSFKGEMIC